MKSILFILLFFCSVKAFAQIPAPDSCGGNRVNSCVNWYKALAADSAFYLPVRTGLNRYIAKGTLAPRPQIFIYNDILYYYTNGNYYSVSGGSTFDTVSLSNRIDLRMLISDTVNNFGGRFLSNIIGITAGGDLSSTYPNPTVAKFNGQFPSYYLNYNNLTNRPDLTGFIPITGTTTGNPVTGDIHIDAGGSGAGIVFNDVNDDMSRLLANGSRLTFNSLDGVHKNWNIDGTDLIDNSLFKFINHGSATVDTIATLHDIRTGGPTPNLQQVTDANYITNNPLVVTNSIGDFVSSLLTFSGDGLLDISKADGTKTVNVTPTTIDFNDNISGFASTIDGFSNAATQNNDIEMPNASGTIALSVNSKSTDGLGNVNIDAIDVGVKVVPSVGVATYVVPVGTLVETILIQEPTNITVDVGTTPGGNDLIAGWNIMGGASSLGLNYYSTSSSTIYVTGLTGSSQLKIYKR